ncbi:MAG: hypothetical protein IT282_05005 [Bacteroidetes bacterium]|nr:hypothetical protein [Bacteroidota bacterium]
MTESDRPQAAGSQPGTPENQQVQVRQPQTGGPGGGEQQTGGTPADAPLIHPLSALLLIIVDALWTIPDMAAFAWILTIPACFLAVFLPSLLIQKFVKKDSFGKSLGVSAALGVLAAIPTPITGTAVGAIALGLSGLRSLGGKR